MCIRDSVSAGQVQQETGYGPAPLAPNAHDLWRGKGKGPPKPAQDYKFRKDANYCFAWSNGGCKDPCANGCEHRCLHCGDSRRLRDYRSAPPEAKQALERLRK
eukprot:11579370-Alexandrium_andersonii.AAC.1